MAPINFGVTTGVACLSHDIGNPPFGHSGEDAIQYWFRTSRLARDLLDQMDGRQQGDFWNFDGNAQGFRILTRLQNHPAPGGLQLTCATLGTFTKYPRESKKSTDTEELPKGASTKKHGYFQCEAEMFKEVAEEVGLIQRTSAPHSWTRHPLAFLVEAADDICYRIIDFEDGYKLQCVKFDDIRDLFMRIVTDSRDRQALNGIDDKGTQISILRAKAINVLVTQIAGVFLEMENAILDGAYDTSLIEVIGASRPLGEIFKKSKQLVYTEQSVLDVEAAGFEVISGLLETFVGAVTDIANTRRRPSERAKKYLELLPERYRNVEPDPYKRVLGLTDYISGMTDSFAVALYKKIRGISLPNA